MTDVPPGATPYEVLGVDRHASTDDLRRAYRRRLRETHPDLGGDPTVFYAVQLAWERVGTPGNRAEYDRSRTAAPRSTRPGHGAEADSQRVWTTGTSRGTASAPSRARSYGHPGGWSRERYLTLMREWVGRGVPLDDPYDDALVARAPREIKHALADALAEESTARSLATLGSGFAIWNDVATAAGSGGWAGDATAAASDPAKIDHIVLGPTGLFAIQSEDWGAPARVRRGELVSEALGPDERPVRALARRARLARSLRVTFTALVVVLPDDAIGEAVTVLGKIRGVRTVAVRRSALLHLLTSGLPGTGRLGDADLFETRTRLQRGLNFA